MKVNLFKSSSSAGRSNKPPARPSIRGKISGPIPIPSPADDEFPIRKPGSAYVAPKAPPSDEEFPIRRPGAARASTIPIEVRELEPSDMPGHEQEAAEAAAAQELQPDASAVSGTRTDVEQSNNASAPPPSNAPPAPPPGASPASGSGGGSAPRTSPTQHRTNPSSTLRYSQVSAASTGNTGGSGSGRPQRKKSTLRNALSRLFGRRKKTASQGSNETESAGMSQQHRSDPTALNRSKDNEPKRSASLPLTEYGRALRSHSVGPDDITAIESARNSLHTDPAQGGRRRAATTTSSRLYTRPRRGEPGEWAGLSPRPASAHGRGSQTMSLLGGAEDPNEIGRAITSDHVGGGGELNHRRRSRSLSGMQDMTAEGGGRAAARRRSDEIRYWRESYDPGFMSPALSSGGGGGGLSSGGLDYGDNDTGAVSVSIPESPVVERPPKTPPQPFTFGSIAVMNEMAGMKITQAASLESRIGSLEVRMLKLERVVNQLCHAVPGFKSPLAEFLPETVPRSVPAMDQPLPFAYTTAAPPMIPAIYQAISAGGSGGGSSRQSVETDAHSHMSFGEGQTYIGSLHPPSSSATQSQSIPAAVASPLLPPPIYRPTSTSTVRGATSLPTLGGAHTPEAEGPDVAAQLEAERAARQALEAQVRKLSERVNALSSTMFAMVRDPAKSRSQERLAGGVVSASSTNTPTKGQQQQSSSLLSIPPVPKASSVFEDDDDDDDSDFEGNKEGTGAAVPSELGDETPSEAFQTPGEERAHYGAFGEELREDDDPKRKKAARTLSLSQLTLGKETQI